VFVFNLIVSGKIAIIATPNAFSSFRFLKEKIGEQNFPSGNQKFWFVFRCEGKFY